MDKVKKHKKMKYKIGVFGSAEGDFEKIHNIAIELGSVLAKKNLIVITGASKGLPYQVATSVKKEGGEVWGYSPVTDFLRYQEFFPEFDASVFKKLIYIPKDYEFARDRTISAKLRNVFSTSHCDAGIIISGRWGTLNEFTNLFDMGKVIGVLTGTGGIADELENLSRKIKKKSKARVFFNSNPEILVSDILITLKTQ